MGEEKREKEVHQRTSTSVAQVQSSITLSGGPHSGLFARGVPSTQNCRMDQWLRANGLCLLPPARLPSSLLSSLFPLFFPPLTSSPSFFFNLLKIQITCEFIYIFKTHMLILHIFMFLCNVSLPFCLPYGFSLQLF